MRWAAVYRLAGIADVGSLHRQMGGGLDDRIAADRHA
jgi:hypothetical protein